jgi:RNA polymerase sigma-70 factor (ECF subfamily)
LYAFARHRGSRPEDTQDLVQGFFEHLIESRALRAVDQAKGRFRSFLLASFKNFTSMERRRAGAEKRGGRVQVIRMDWQDEESRIAYWLRQLASSRRVSFGGACVRLVLCSIRTPFT